MSSSPATATPFHRNPLVYFLMTDRFDRGDLQSDDREECAAGSFWGGNFAGITRKIRDGWFRDLGVNALWISAPYQQVLGWVPGGGGTFRHFAYHGYWPLDFRKTEPRFGTRIEFAEFVEAAHYDGLKVIIDVSMSHPGYLDLDTLNAFMPEALRPGWKDATPLDYERFIDQDSDALARWWNRDWIIQAGSEPDSSRNTDFEPVGHGLARFRTECDQVVSLPAFLQGYSYDLTPTQAKQTVRHFLIEWLCDWVARHGVDGFRCDSVKHVGMAAWADLREAADKALTRWRSVSSPMSDKTSSFWMVGEVFGNGIDRSKYHDNGFDALINFDFQTSLQDIFKTFNDGNEYLQSLCMHRLDKLYAAYAKKLAEGEHDVLSYLSSHDTFLFDQRRYPLAAAALMMVPGGIHLFYGDESGRVPLECPGEAEQGTRSPMNWSTLDHELLAHWRRLGRFRQAHVSLARGSHRRLMADPYVFARVDEISGDKVVVAFCHTGFLEINVTSIFDDGTELADAYSGGRCTVQGGHVGFESDTILLLSVA